MPFMPFSILGMWFRGLLGIVILGGAIYLLKEWYDECHFVEAVHVDAVNLDAGSDLNRDGTAVVKAPVAGRRVFRFEPGLNRETGLLAAGLALLTWAVVGRFVIQGASNLFTSSSSGTGSTSGPSSAQEKHGDAPKEERGGKVHTITRPDGSILHVECYGPADAPPIVLTHGWGANSTEWYYIKRNLADRFRLIIWDEPGLGLSKKPDNNDYRIENLAADLDAVLGLAGGRPALLVGHSIGGMIILTLAKALPETIARKVSGLLLVHTTYTNPVRTTSMAALYTAIEKPVIVPLLYLTIALWPLVWVMNWMSYINGTAYRSTKKSSFAGTETSEQVEFVARLMPQARPDVLARGMLGMIGYDATATLSTIGVPVLVVAGDQDTTTLPEASQFMAKSVPHGRLVTLSPAKHMGLIEHHAQFDRLVSEFAASCVPAGTTR